MWKYNNLNRWVNINNTEIIIWGFFFIYLKFGKLNQLSKVYIKYFLKLSNFYLLCVLTKKNDFF